MDNSTDGGIKEAIATANPGDTIVLESGVYTGTNNTSYLLTKVYNKW